MASHRDEQDPGHCSPIPSSSSTDDFPKLYGDASLIGAGQQMGAAEDAKIQLSNILGTTY